MCIQLQSSTVHISNKVFEGHGIFFFVLQLAVIVFALLPPGMFSVRNLQVVRCGPLLASISTAFNKYHNTISDNSYMSPYVFPSFLFFIFTKMQLCNIINLLMQSLEFEIPKYGWMVLKQGRVLVRPHSVCSVKESPRCLKNKIFFRSKV